MAYDINEVSDHVEMLQRAGATDDQIVEFLGKAGWSLDQYVAQVNRLNEAGGGYEELGPVEGAVGSFAQGATLGFGDEAAAGAQALYDIATGPATLGDFPELYGQGRAKADLAQGDWARENPNANALLTGAGGASTALIPGGPMMQVAKGGVSPAYRIGSAAWTGGVAGGTAAVGAAQPGDDLRGAAAEGALMGAGTGAVMGGAFEGLTALKEPVSELADYVMGVVRGRRTGPAGHAGAAQAGGALPQPLPGPGAAPAASPGPSRRPKVGREAERVLQAIERDGMTPLDLAGAARTAADGGTPMTLAELGGPNLQGLGRATVTLPGQGRALAESGLLPSAKPGAQRGRLEGQLEELADRPIPSPDELVDELKARQQRRRGDYRALSNQVGPVADEELIQSLERRPIYREGWEADNASRTRVGEELPPLFDAQGRLVRSPTVEDFQGIKNQLDAEVYGAEGILTPETAKAKANIGRVEGARRELVEQADRVIPEYAEVRAKAGGDFEVERAAEKAREISRLSPQEVRDFMRTASEDAKATFRAQAMLSLRDKMLADSDRGAYPALVRDLWGSGDGKMAAVMQEAFGGDAAKFGAFRSAMEREMQKARTRNFMFGGSQTANKLAEVADLQGDGFGDVAMNLAWGGPQAAATGAFARWMSKASGRAQAGYFEGTRDAVAQRLFTDPVEATEDFLMSLERVRQAREASMRLAPVSVAGAAGAAAERNARPGAGP